MNPWGEDLAQAVQQLKRAIWADRWSLGIFLGLVWLGVVAFVVWRL